jgi:serine/threonine protein kinase
VEDTPRHAVPPRHDGSQRGLAQGMDLVTRRPVALKKVHAEVLDEDSVTFLMREVTLLRALDHPNVLKLLDVASSAEKQTIFLVRGRFSVSAQWRLNEHGEQAHNNISIVALVLPRLSAVKRSEAES